MLRLFVFFLVGIAAVAKAEVEPQASVGKTVAAEAVVSEAFVVKDLTGQQMTFSEAPKKIISLAPSITENLYRVGAGEQLVGTVSYSDYPEAAKALPVIGRYDRFNREAITALQPDLIIGWLSGNGTERLQQLRDLGLPVFVIEAYQLEDIAANLRLLGKISGHAEKGEKAASDFEKGLADLHQDYGVNSPVSVFYEVWNQPLRTVSDRHPIGDVIRLCGGVNVFGELPMLTPSIGLEGVLAADPQVIVASGMGVARPEWLDDWRVWPQMSAVKNEHLYFIPPDLLQRHTVRMLLGAQQMCAHINKARKP